VAVREGAPLERFADRTTLLAFVALVIIGGGNGVAIRFSNQELPPFWGAGLRFAITSLGFAVLVALRRNTLPRGRPLASAVIFGVLRFGAAYALLYWGLLKVQAGVTQVILTTIPLLTLFVAVTHGQERFRINRLIGSLLAVGGIALIFGERITGGTVPAMSLLSILAAALCIAEGTVVAKGLPRLPIAVTNAVAMGVGAVCLFSTSLAAHETWRIPQRATTWAALVYLIALGSAAVFALYLFILRRWDASAAVYQEALFPIVAVLLSSWLDHEALTIDLIAGGLLVIAGVYVGALARARSPG